MITKSELKVNVEATGSHFFDHKTMEFFGDKMSNWGLRSVVIKCRYNGKVACWELYRKEAVKNNLKTSAFFAKDDFSRVHPQD